jgi:hypothetical protein
MKRRPSSPSCARGVELDWAATANDAGPTPALGAMTSRMDRRTGALVLLVAVVLVGCAAGDARFTPDEPAGFWTGLWHGMISCVALIVGIFVDGVRVYEIDNTGGWYDFGFLLGVSAVWGGGSHGYRRSERKRSAETARSEAEWKEIGRKVEAKIRRRIRGTQRTCRPS